MRALNHLISGENKQSDFSPEASFAPPSWYFEQDLWIQDAMAPGNAAHNYPLPMRIRGPLNQKAMKKSLQQILRRHSVLRSVFRMLDRKPAQLIMPLQPPAMPVLDLVGLPEDERESEVKKAVFEDARSPFDLTRGPMLRSRLLRLGAEDHILLLTTHHIVCDYWSTRILLRELFTLHSAFSVGQPSPLPELGYQYGDFVRWLETRLQGGELESRLRFWKERLAGKRFHHLAPDHLPPVSRSYRGTHETAIYPKELGNSINVLSARERLSPFMIMLAGLQCLVQRYSGHKDIGIGSCVANRPLLELEGLIGPFANVSVLRTDLSGDPSFREVFRRVREMSLAAYSYQDTPFGMLVDNFQPAFDPARHPLFQMLFVFLNTPSEPWEAPGLTVDPIAIDTGTSCFELNMNVRIHERFQVDLQYSSDLFEAATIRDILQDYRAVLEKMCTNPDARIGELAIKEKQAAKKGQQQGKYLGTEYMTANGAIESQLVELWEAVLDKRPIGVNDNFFELGGDSLRAARLFARIEQTFGRSLPLGTLFQSPTIVTLAKVICEGSSSSKYVVSIQHGNSRPPLFCAHGQSGSVLMYRSLARHLGSDQPVYGVQQEALDSQTRWITSIEDMAAAYVREIELIQGEGPYCLLGYCMGGTIAFEMAQQLRRRGRHISLVALLDTYNWGQIRPSWPDDLLFSLQMYWYGLRHFLLLCPEDRSTFLRRRSEELWSKEPEISEQNRRAALGYVPKVYPGRILHVRPLRQYSRYNRPELSLNGLAENGVEEYWVRGYPSQILEEPLVRDLAAKLRACIDDVAAQWKSTSDRSSEMMPPMAAS